MFEKLAKWANAQVSKGVLGQTASTEGTPGKLGNEEAQQEVRRELVRADAKQLAATLNRDLVKPFIDLNFGPPRISPSNARGQYPRILMPVPEDVGKLVENVARLVPLGLKVEQSVIRDKLGLPDPEDDAELLSAPAPPALPDPELERANNLRRALNASAEEEAEFDELERLGLEGWEEQITPMLQPLRELVEDASSYEDVESKLTGLLDRMAITEITRELAKRMFMARGTGGGRQIP